MYFAAALEADGGVELLRGSVITARQQLEAVERVYFCSIPARRSTFPARRPARDTGTDIDLGYLGHIFVVAERFFQLNADEAGEPSSVAVRNDDNLAPVCKKRGANAFFRSLALAVELCIETLKLPASPTDANLIILLSLPRVLCPHYSIFFLKM